MQQRGRPSKQYLKQEFIKCKKDPFYFIENYCYIVTAKTEGQGLEKRLFKLYDFQRNVLEQIISDNDVIILKSRQLGLSTLIAAYVSWRITFKSNENITLISRRSDEAKDLLKKVKVILEKLPSFLKLKLEVDNVQSIKLSNGSFVKSESKSKDAGRSATLTFIVFDECAFVEKEVADAIWKAAQPTLTTTGGKAILISCVTKDTFVFTGRGIKQVEDFIQDKKEGGYFVDRYSILGKNELRSNNIMYNSGITKTKVIKTRHSSLEGSYPHKLWGCIEGKYNWYKLEEFSVGDWVSLQYGMELWGNNDDVSDFKATTNHRHKNIFIPNKITKEISYLLGLYLSEGSSYKKYNKNGKFVGGSITITCGDDVSKAINNCKLNYSNTDNMHYSIGSKTLIEFMEYLGFDLSLKANKKYIPKRLLEMSRENIIYLIRGIMDGDGWSRKDRGSIGIGLSSKKMIDQIRIIFNNFGILTHYQFVEGKTHPASCVSVPSDSYRLGTDGRNSIIFYDKIGFGFERKQLKRKVLEEKNMKRNNSHDIIPYGKEYIKSKVKEMKISLHKLRYTYGIRLKEDTPHISRGQMLKFSNYFGCDPEVDFILSENIIWDQITDIKDSENETFDFSLAHDEKDFWCHSVIYNGFLGHQTPNGMGGFFYNMWAQAEEETNGFIPIKLPWNIHPNRDKHWEREERRRLNNDQMAFDQEHQCDFISSVRTVVDIKFLLKYFEETKIEPLMKRTSKISVEKEGKTLNFTEYADNDENVWIYEQPVPDKKYLLSSDVARGDASDLSSMFIVDEDTLDTVVEFRGYLDTNSFANLIYYYSKMFNNALTSVENDGVGWAVIQRLLDLGDINLIFTTKERVLLDQNRIGGEKMSGQKVPGFTLSAKVRPLVIDKLTKYINDGSYRVKSIRLLNELKTFVYINGKAQALDSDCHDDLCLALSELLYVYETFVLSQRRTEERLNSMLRFMTNSKDGAKIVASDDTEAQKNLEEEMTIKRRKQLVNNYYQKEIGTVGNRKLELDQSEFLKG